MKHALTLVKSAVFIERMECFSICADDVFCPCRLSRYQQFKDFQRRILVATNLFGRGMDIERVNIVFNYDMPEDSDTYLHRVSVRVMDLVMVRFASLFFLLVRLSTSLCLRLHSVRLPVQVGLEPKVWP